MKIVAILIVFYPGSWIGSGGWSQEAQRFVTIEQCYAAKAIYQAHARNGITFECIDGVVK